ncbi:MAG: hypothetical protein CL433_11105 [Acidimicrobiaceae bacterium]|jgi:two-component system sensor histidine kinase MprB|nr:hypothetical protein [Acidimicrobiaceae bacterium]HAB56595.1 hypothetical protein [Acidimicrobiaceae bacterium]
MSLRLRITLVVALVVTAVVAVVGQRVYAAAERELVEEVDIELQGRAAGFMMIASGPQFREAFTRSALQDLAAEGFAERRGARSFLDQTARDNFSRVVSPNGEVIFNVDTSFSVDLAPTDYPRGGDAPVLSDGSVDGGRARIATIAANDVFVQLARPLGEIDQSLDDLAGRIVFISVVAILAAAAAAWFISGGTVAPIRRLTDAAERVAATGDLKQTVDGSGGAEVDRLARSFNSMLEALSASRRQQHRLVMNASHELRTPLASLQTNIDVLRSEREIPEETRTAIVDDICAEISELGDLVAELVDLATDVRTDEDPMPVELVELAAPVVGRQARRTQRTIELDVRQRAVVEARPQAVSRAIRNLVENAAKFSPDETSITVIVDGGAVTVLDAGPGIPEADRSMVFDRFHRVETTRTMPGSGLGLAIVKQVADVHGGSVSATEAPGGGAAVGFVLPTVDD